MTTELTYLTDPSIMIQSVSAIEKSSDDKGIFLLLDRTPAYPQGGGQESDIGWVKTTNDQTELIGVRRDGDLIKHYLKDDIEIVNNGSIEIEIDLIRRMENSVLHTAGHLVASIAYSIIPNLTPIKGHHFRSGSYIELRGDFTDTITDLKTDIQEVLNRDINSMKSVSWNISSAEDLIKKCPFIQPGIPTNSELRCVHIDSYFPMACGGTHVEFLREIGPVEITKAKYKKGILRVSYKIVLD